MINHRGLLLLLLLYLASLFEKSKGQAYGSNSSIFIRLFDPSSTTTNNDTIQGRLEIYYNGIWSTVCATGFSDVAAGVVCASLGFGRSGRVIRNIYGISNGNNLLNSVYCIGNELSIADCSHSAWSSQNYCYDESVAISCSNSSIFIRLFDPNSTTTSNSTMEGRLEIYFNGVWGTVCANGFSDAAARVVCSSLGFGRIGKFIRNDYGTGNRNILFDYVSCNGNELSITDCQQSRYGLYDYCNNQEVAVSCSNAPIFIRLFDPNSTTTNNDTIQGRLEIYYNGVWRTVCANGFSDVAARVVCASLGLGRTGRVIRNPYGQFGYNNGNILFDSLYCIGDELSITNCSHSSWGSENYCYYGDVAISCSNSSIFLRLFDSNSTTTNNDTMQGRLEIYFNGVWGTVCNIGFSDAAARVVCSSLGFGRIGRFIRNSYGPGNRNILFDYVSCNGNELSIIDCYQHRVGYDYDCYNEEVAVSCSNSSVFIRLFDPNSTTTHNDTIQGRLDIYYNGFWGTVCAYGFSDVAARVVCASLGFGRTGRVIRNFYGPGSGNILFDSVFCIANESSITDCYLSRWGSDNYCSYGDVAISCIGNSSIFVRLFDPHSKTTNNETTGGRLEIYFNGVWGTVCSNGFSDAAARVVCSSLGFGRIGRFFPNPYGPGNRNILFDYVWCNGNELSIIDCQQSRFGAYDNCNNQEVAVSCSNSTVIRLFDPNSTTTNNDTMEGRLEIYFNGVWGTVCPNGFTDAAARVVCSSLGFGRIGRFIRNSYGPGNRSMLFDYVYCNGNELSLTECQPFYSMGYDYNCYNQEVAVSCSNSSVFIRLFDPNSTTTNNDTIQGRLEIYYNGVWGTVCPNGFSDVAARVVCASLSFGATGRVIRNSYGPSNGSTLFDSVYCIGNELSITDCSHSRWDSDNYCFNGEVALSCSNSSVFIRLFDPNSATTNNNTMQGRLEIYFNGVWGTVCASGFSDAAARVVCNSLNFGQTGKFIRNDYGPGNKNILLDYVSCNGNELSITDCQQYRYGYDYNCNNDYAAVSCSNSSILTRLFDPNSTNTNNDTIHGRLEIYFNGVWGTVCAYGFSDVAARVVCSSLGFRGTGKEIPNLYTPSSGNILFDSVYCIGNELSITDCSHSRWGSESYCPHRDVAVGCGNPSIIIRFVDQNSTTANNDTIQGRLEIYYYGVWGTVCAHGFSDVAARVVCASLGLGRTGRVIRNVYGPSNRSILFSSVNCIGNESSITDCTNPIFQLSSICNYGDVAMSCSNSSIFTRLFDPNSTTTNNNTMEGRLELYFNGVWGTVCANGFSEAAARVVCSSLGFGRIGRFIRNDYGTGNRNILFDSVSCNGNEQSIADCRQYRFGSDYYCNNDYVAVSCSNSPVFIRLLDPNLTTTNNDTIQGRLEIYYYGIWGTVCAHGFSDVAARVVCASLGFGRTGRVIRNVYGPSNGNILFDSVYCIGNESSITDCSHSRWGSESYCNNRDVAISCSNSSIFIRLFDPNSTTTNNDTMEGRLEIYFNGVWGTICNNGFSDAAARVVCSSLGFGRIGRFIRNSYGTGNRSVLFDYFSCTGNEQSITDCQQIRLGYDYYCYNQEVAVSCSNSSIFIRLFDPNSTTTNNDTMQGRLEVYFNGVWGTVCANSYFDDIALVVCASLGLGRAGRVIRNTYGPGDGDVLFDYFSCNGGELSITDCSHSMWGSANDCYYGEVAVSCSNSSIFVRLFDPDSKTTNNDTMEGRLEVYFNGAWGTVCAYDFSDAAAQVVCSSLGFGRVGRFFINPYGPGNRNILFDYVWCNGNEQSITDCGQFRYYGFYDYCNNEEVAISCKNASDTTIFPLTKTNPFHTTSKTTIPISNISHITTLGIVTALIETSKVIVRETTQKATTLRIPTSLIEVSEATTGVVSTVEPETEMAITPKMSTSLMKTSKITPGVLSNLGSTGPVDTTTASKIASGELSTTRDVSFVSTTVKSTSIMNINECDSLPCLHTATCVDLVNDYKCSCAQGFTGRNCETVFNPCDTLPCINGTCNNHTETCACIAGYRGRLCEEEIAECDSDPCQHDSTCVDGLNSYQCQCLGGYTGSNCETEMNECESSPCPINFTCESSVNRYQCICPNPDEFIGVHCDIPVSSPEKSDSPEFIRASPNHGPMSGGTKMTITGRNLDKYGGIFFTYIGNMKLPIRNWTSSWSEFLVVTTAGDSSIVGQDQNLTFEITGGKNVSTELTFTYYPDPEIEDVKPIEQLASGGTTLTVIGNNLNSSASPYLQVILNTTTSGRLNKNITVVNGPTCDASSSTEIYCLMPRVNVVGTTVINQPGSRPRKRRDANSQNITTYVTLNLISDDAKDSPNKSIELVEYHGFLEPVKGPMSFNPDDDPFIHIKGEMLSDGIVVDDYEISVGIGVCTNKSLTANELNCRPPIEEPDPGSYQALYCSESGGLPVIVFPGKKVDTGDRKQLHWACLIYPDSKFSWWIVGVICGGCALLLALTVVCFVVCRRRPKRLLGVSKQRVYSRSRKSRKNIDPAKADWSKVQVNAQGDPMGESRNMINDTYASRIADDIVLSNYHNDLSMRKFGNNDYSRTLVPDGGKSSIYVDERGRQMTQYELDMIAAERNARDLRNPISARYSYGRLSGYYSRDAAPHDSSNYTNNKTDREMYAVQDWRNQGRPTRQKQFGGNWNASDNAISVAPAYFLGQNRGLRSPMYGSLDLPTTGDYTGHKVGYRGQ